MRRWLWLVTALVACDEQAPAPQEAAPTVSASAFVARVRLVYEAGSPLETARVAERLRKRLSSEGDVEIGGESIFVDVPENKVAAIKKKLGAGRLDVYALDEKADLGKPEEPVEVREGYLVAPDRAKLVQHFAGARVLTGPLFEGAAKPKLYRAYPVSGNSLRGEHAARAAVRHAGSTTMLDIAFEGAGKSFVRWGSKQGVRFVLLVDGDVISTLQPEAEIEDGQLAFPIEQRGDLATTLKTTRAIAEALHGVALSHAVKLAKEKPLR
ncbi:MAG TPA: hypothetical protein VFB62_02630 [Polyangiaceae bacterium]|jgi:hypothetical protein|nr:hypothetical protein [Polyangiaceae bacterium]